MQKEELKTLVKKYFNLTEKTTEVNNDEAKEISFAEATLVDGTKVTNMLDAEFEVGQELHVITEDGQHVLAPSGEHTTESGIVVTVDGEGKITGIARPDSTDEGSLSEEVMAEEKVELEEHEDETMEEDSEEIIAMEESDVKEAIIEAIAEVIAPEIEAMKKKMAEIEEAMKEAMNAPAAPSTTESTFSKTKKTENNYSLGREPFNAKKAQYEMVMAAINKKSKK